MLFQRVIDTSRVTIEGLIWIDNDSSFISQKILLLKKYINNIVRSFFEAVPA